MQSPDTDHQRWLGPQPRGRAEVPKLFCFPYAGGGSAIFRGWDALIIACDVVPIRLPGREMRLSEPASSRLSELVPTIADAIVESAVRRFAFFGHSMGGLIAYEVTRELERRGDRLPSLLCVSARHTPSGQIGPEWERAPYLGDDDFVAFLGGLSPDTERLLADRSLRELVLPALRADFRLCVGPRASGQDLVSVPILSLAGSDDQFVRPHETMSWAEFTDDRFAQEVIQGDHFFVTSNAVDVCACLNGHLERVFDVALVS